MATDHDVVLGASGGLPEIGLLGLVFLPGRAPAARSWRATTVAAVCAPLVGLVVLFSVTDACPLYVTRGSGYCYYYFDMLGGWAASVAIAVGLDVLGIAFLLGVSAWQARLALHETHSARSARSRSDP